MVVKYFRIIIRSKFGKLQKYLPLFVILYKFYYNDVKFAGLCFENYCGLQRIVYDVQFLTKMFKHVGHFINSKIIMIMSNKLED